MDRCYIHRIVNIIVVIVDPSPPFEFISSFLPAIHQITKTRQSFPSLSSFH